PSTSTYARSDRVAARRLLSRGRPSSSTRPRTSPATGSSSAPRLRPTSPGGSSTRSTAWKGSTTSRRRSGPKDERDEGQRRAAHRPGDLPAALGRKRDAARLEAFRPVALG